jgi:hypothetical protein
MAKFLDLLLLRIKRHVSISGQCRDQKPPKLAVSSAPPKRAVVSWVHARRAVQHDDVGAHALPVHPVIDTVSEHNSQVFYTAIAILAEQQPRTHSDIERLSMRTRQVVVQSSLSQAHGAPH